MRGSQLDRAGPWFDLGGTVRAAPPGETLARVRPLMERLGITRVARLTELDVLGVPVSVAIRPLGRLLSTALGKGLTPELADVSAVMESIETWHAEHLPAPAAVGRAADVGPIVELAPAPGWLRAGDDRGELAWLRVRELHSGEERLAPAACFDLDTAALARDRLAARFRPTTTGLASGNTRDEALLHALCELIERDAVARMDAMDAGELDARRLDLASVPAGPAAGVLERFARAGLEIEVLDITSDVGVPAFHATIADPDPLRGGFIDRGMGAHVAPEIALVRALVEAAQSRLGYISGSRDDFWPDDYDRAALPAGAPAAAPRGRRALAACARLDVGADWPGAVQAVLARLTEPVWMLDHTRPELGVPVVHLRCPARLDSAGARA